MAEEYKGYEISSNVFSNRVIKPIGKGSVPKELRGVYTSAAVAKSAIDAVVEAQVKPTSEVTKNATAKNSGRVS